VFGEPELFRGAENFAAVVRTLISEPIDAIQLSPGLGRFFQDIEQPHKPALVLRVDVTNTYAGNEGGAYSEAPEGALETALRLDAVALVANLLEVEGDPDVRRQSVSICMRLGVEAQRVGMPLMIEPLAFKRAAGGKIVSDTTEIRLLGMVRQAAELGADLVKVDAPVPAESIGTFVLAVPVPIFMRGGTPTSDGDLLSRTRRALDVGVQGLVVGRQVFGASAPAQVVRRLSALIHSDASLDEGSIKPAGSGMVGGS
jgi:DhnA family fructose-bisphosphate aldolase class Ia